jgi:hypothetical protein
MEPSECVFAKQVLQSCSHDCFTVMGSHKGLQHATRVSKAAVQSIILQHSRIPQLTCHQHVTAAAASGPAPCMEFGYVYLGTFCQAFR